MNCIIPYGDRILVERIEAEERTAGGIILSDGAKEKPMIAKVIAVGNGPRNDNGEHIKMDFKEGEIVFFTKYSGSEIKDGLKEYLILSERDIIAKKNAN